MSGQGFVRSFDRHVPDQGLGAGFTAPPGLLLIWSLRGAPRPLRTLMPMDDEPPPVNDEDPPFDPARGALVTRLHELKQQHQDLDAAIGALASSRPDQLQIARLKKQKLLLRDQIAKLEDQLTPDIIA